MQTIWIDTALLAIPNYAVTESYAEELFERVSHFEQLARKLPAIKIVLSDFAEHDLWSRNLGPDYGEIDAFIQVTNLVGVFSPNDLLKLYQSLIQHCLPSSTIARVEVREVGNFYSSPEFPSTLTPTTAVDLTKCCFSTLALLHQWGEHSWLLGSAFEERGPIDFHIQAEALAIETHASIDAENTLSVSAPVRAFTRLSDLVNEDDAIRLWKIAETEGELYLAISLYALAIRRKSNPQENFSSLHLFSIAASFRPSLGRN